MSNILRCKKCGDIITSDERHDMNWCKCGAIAIDGGDDYCKITGNPEDMEVFAPAPIFKNLQTEQVKEKQEHQEAMLVADKTIKMLEKALELACETIKSMCPRPLWIGGTIPAPEVKDAEYFKEIAKEMMKSE